MIIKNSFKLFTRTIFYFFLKSFKLFSRTTFYLKTQISKLFFLWDGSRPNRTKMHHKDLLKFRQNIVI